LNLVGLLFLNHTPIAILITIVTQNAYPPPEPDAATKHAIAKRDGGRCCVTGKPGTLLDPLIVAPILQVPTGWLTDRV
jgi:hypothetical protein